MVRQKKIEFLVLTLLILVTWVVSVFHEGTAKSLDKALAGVQAGKSRWIPKSEIGIHQLILEGEPAERGLAAGQRTVDLLLKQEESLFREVERVFPSPLFRQIVFLAAMRWFYDLDEHIEREMLEEMWGVSKSAPTKFNALADPYTRQIAYHALHEVGQSFVDMNPQGFACTVLAVPEKGSWVLGRNFDFEGGRVFDEEKIMKWVYPTKGHPFLSVTWAGMVGVVTGVNAKGLYVSLNAAGTDDFRRVGTPTTLVILKSLQEASSMEEARTIIENAETFITDIFIVAQKGVPYIYRIEKSPKRFVTRKEEEKFAVANHLISEPFAKDSVNTYRRTKMTSSFRLWRAEEILKKWDLKKDSSLQILSALRDHKALGGKVLPLGDRNTIDALIATHSVVWDGVRGQLYVSTGPSASGKFIGFDLDKSFAAKEPVLGKILPADPDVSPERYLEVHKARAEKEGRLP